MCVCVHIHILTQSQTQPCMERGLSAYQRYGGEGSRCAGLHICAQHQCRKCQSTDRDLQQQGCFPTTEMCVCMYVYVCVCMCLCVCVYVCVMVEKREREREGDYY